MGSKLVQKMIYTKDIAFIHVPKTGGMSIKKSIEINCPDAKYMPEDTFSDEIVGTDWREVMHYPYSHWESLLEDKWVFSVVRNPFVRAVSLYVFFKKLYAFKDNLNDFTFEELYSKKNKFSTTTQTEIITGKNNKVPNIFKYEDGYSKLEDKLGFKINQQEMINPKYNYLDYYNEGREKLIFNIFEKDFENFSYSANVI